MPSRNRQLETTERNSRQHHRPHRRGNCGNDVENVEQLREQNAALRDHNATKTTELKNANDECTTLRKSLRDTEKEVIETKDKMLELHEQLRAVEAARAILQTERDVARQASAKAEQHALDNEAKRRTEIQGLQTKLQAARDKVTEVAVKLDEGIMALKADKNQLTHKVHKYQNDFAALQAKYELAINQNRELQNQHRELQSQNRELQNQHLELQNENRELQSKADQDRRDLLITDNMLIKAQRERNELRDAARRRDQTAEHGYTTPPTTP